VPRTRLQSLQNAYAVVVVEDGVDAGDAVVAVAADAAGAVGGGDP